MGMIVHILSSRFDRMNKLRWLVYIPLSIISSIIAAKYLNEFFNNKNTIMCNSAYVIMFYVFLFMIMYFIIPDKKFNITSKSMIGIIILTMILESYRQILSSILNVDFISVMIVSIFALLINAIFAIEN